MRRELRPTPILEFVLTPHAEMEMARRGIDAALVRSVLNAPGQRITVRPGREVLQAKLSLGDPPKVYLVRVFVDVDRTPAEVVTVYKTSRPARYWQEDA